MNHDNIYTNKRQTVNKIIYIKIDQVENAKIMENIEKEKSTTTIISLKNRPRPVKTKKKYLPKAMKAKIL